MSKKKKTTVSDLMTGRKDPVQAFEDNDPAAVELNDAETAADSEQRPRNPAFITCHRFCPDCGMLSMHHIEDCEPNGDEYKQSYHCDKCHTLVYIVRPLVGDGR